MFFVAVVVLSKEADALRDCDNVGKANVDALMTHATD